MIGISNTDGKNLIRKIVKTKKDFNTNLIFIFIKKN